MSFEQPQPLDAAAAVSRVRQLSVGGVLDEALRIVHERYGSLLRVSLLFVAVPLGAAMYFGIGALAELGQGFNDALDGRQVDFRPLLLRVLWFTLPLLTLAYRVAEPLALGALVVVSAGVLTGHRPSAGAAVRHSLRCSVPLITMWLLRWVCVQLGTLACYAPGLLLAGLFFTALPALVLERLGPIEAFSRSIALNKKRLGESILLVLLLGLIETVVVQWSAQLLPHGILQSVGVGILYSSLLALYAAAATVFYFSGRCQREHYDLELWVHGLARRDELESGDTASPLFRPQVASGPSSS